MNDGIILFVFFSNAVLLGIAGWHDFQSRSVSLRLLLALNCLPILGFLWHFDWILDNNTWLVIYFCLFFLVAALVKIVGAADVFVAIAISLLILCADSTLRYTLLMTFILWTGIATILWYFWRIIKSLKISGIPKNVWDVIALKMGRLEKEPELTKYLHNELHGRDFNRFIDHVEVFRTPDGCHLYPDSCPLVTCFFVGYIRIIILLL
ncbi:MAG: hypothetical protein ABFS56_24690 [Pseudomonadota bacterium]